MILCAFAQHNVHLLLLSGIGKPYDPRRATPASSGRNYAYQITSVGRRLRRRRSSTRSWARARSGRSIDDFNGDNFDHGPHGFVGGGYIALWTTGGRPILQHHAARGHAELGRAVRRARWPRTTCAAVSIATHGSVMSYRDAYLDLDPTYRDVYGNPLLRLTFDFHDNEHRMSKFLTDRADGHREGDEAARRINVKQREGHYSIVPYQTTHNTGGAIMGTDPRTSVVNRYLQSWDVPNVFVMGACAFPQNAGYNPTGTVGALTYWAARRDPQRSTCSKPGPLVSAREDSAIDTRRRRCASGAAPALRRPPCAARDRARDSLRARSSAAATSRTPATARPVTRRTAASRSPAAAPFPRRSARSTRPTSRPTRKPASARGRDDDFWRAMHEGIGRDGQHLYPAFPVPVVHEAHARRRARDQGLPRHARSRCAQANKPPELPWPLQLRGVGGRMERAVLQTGTYRSDPQKIAPNGIAVHTSSKASATAARAIRRRTSLGAPKRDERSRAAWAKAGSRRASAATCATVSARGRRSDIVEYLKTGANAQAAAFGPMAEVVRELDAASRRRATCTRSRSTSRTCRRTNRRGKRGTRRTDRATPIVARGAGSTSTSAPAATWRTAKASPACSRRSRATPACRRTTRRRSCTSCSSGAQTRGTRDKPERLRDARVRLEASRRDRRSRDLRAQRLGQPRPARSASKVADTRRTVVAARAR